MSVKRLVPLNAVVLDSDPLTGRTGDIYYNSIDECLKFFDGTSWLEISAAATGVLTHTHTYDGAIYSVGSTEYFDDGTEIVDGGTA